MAHVYDAAEDSMAEIFTKIARAAEDLSRQIDQKIETNHRDRDAAVKVLEGTRTGVDDVVKASLDNADVSLNSAKASLMRVSQIARSWKRSDG